MNAEDRLRERMARCGAGGADTDECRDAAAYLGIVDGFYVWRIQECPFCGLRHRHGGGQVGNDDPRDFMAHKVAHCMWAPRGSSRGYRMIDVNPLRTAEMVRRSRTECPV